jgi:hypothetical protein
MLLPDPNFLQHFVTKMQELKPTNLFLVKTFWKFFLLCHLQIFMPKNPFTLIISCSPVLYHLASNNKLYLEIDVLCQGCYVHQGLDGLSVHHNNLKNVMFHVVDSRNVDWTRFRLQAVTYCTTFKRTKVYYTIYILRHIRSF